MKREIWGKSAFLFKEMLLFIHKYSKVKRLPHQSNKKNKNKKKYEYIQQSGRKLLAQPGN